MNIYMQYLVVAFFICIGWKAAEALTNGIVYLFRGNRDMIPRIKAPLVEHYSQPDDAPSPTSRAQQEQQPAPQRSRSASRPMPEGID